MSDDTLKNYLADDPPTVVPLTIKPHFETLSNEEKLYAHYISLASFAGTRIVLRQVSAESESIYDLIIELYNHCSGDWKALQHQSGLSDQDIQAFLSYAAQLLGNGGNYKSFGDSKFIPRISPRQLKALATCSSKTLELYERTQGAIYSSEDLRNNHLGYPDDHHVSNYYPRSPAITKEEITLVSNFLEKKGLLPENTRLRKNAQGDFEVLIASAIPKVPQDARDLPESEWSLQGKLEGRKVTLVFGDHALEMSKIVQALSKAAQHAANDIESKMMAEYVTSFGTGSLEAFKRSQRYWIQDKGPVVESDIGFIETFRDPHGIRGEWEGFVAMVNKERTRAFGKLVESAPQHIPKLPWSKDFEKDKFLSPDFTSLEVLSFAGSGIPAGINIPNYDDIRQTEGFKNVSLGNVLSAKAPNEPIPFIKEGDLEVYQKYRDAAFEVQVGLHELLGHGCGKLLQETSNGVYNFDINDPPISPLTQKPVSSWYKPGQTWGSVFGATASSYEECRAECVAMVLCCYSEVLAIFGFGEGKEDDLEGEAGDVRYASYLSMCRAGLASLEMYDPKSRKWGQIHSQARFIILRTFLNAGQDFAALDYSNDDLSDLTIKLDRSKIASHGRPAVERLLQKLQVYKATADLEGATLYNQLSVVDEWWANQVRNVVLQKKTARKVFVQANTSISESDGKVVLKEYPATPAGLIESYAERTYI